jgi:hypothetical protein
MDQHVDIVFDGPPGPEAGRFIEVEDANGNSIRFGEWIQRKDDVWVLRITRTDFASAQIKHASDCRVHDAPAYKAGACTCGADAKARR